MPIRVPPNPLVYEINTRVWLRELSAQHHQPMQLDTIPEAELERLAGLGVDAVWLMGVWSTGAMARDIALRHADLQQEYRTALPDYSPADCAGSPYAVTNYIVSPQLGGPAALAGLRERLSRKNIGVILDFVCNHTACDHPLVLENPGVFVQGTEQDLCTSPNEFFRAPNGAIVAHGRDPYFPPWTDTAQINYAQPAGREAMLQKLLLIAGQCDGVRCDMAMLILPYILMQTWGARLGLNPIEKSFWREAIASVLARHPQFLFIAEAYWDKEAELQREGFHFTYDKTLYDRLLHNDFNGVRQHLRADLNFQKRCARYIENHDESRAAQAFGPARSIAAAAASYFTPGLKLVHDGQIEGRRIKVPVQLTRRVVEPENPEIDSATRHLLALLNDPLLQHGVYSQIDVVPAGYGDRSNEASVALLWMPANSESKTSDTPPSTNHPAPNDAAGSVTPSGFHCTGRARKAGILVVVNLSGSRIYGRIPLPPQLCAQDKQYVFDDRFTGKRYDRDGAELLYPGLYIALEAYQPHLFEICEKT